MIATVSTYLFGNSVLNIIKNTSMKILSSYCNCTKAVLSLKAQNQRDSMPTETFWGRWTDGHTIYMAITSNIMHVVCLLSRKI